MSRWLKSLSVLVVFAGLAMLAGGCGGGKGTPEAAFETFKNAMVNEDFGAAWDCLSKNAQTGMDGMFKMIEGMGAASADDFKKEFDCTPEEFGKLSAREKFIKMGKSQTKKETDPAAKQKEKDEIKSAKVTNTKIEGDKATLTIKTGDKEDTMSLVKEGNEWKFESFK
ncbi:MAG: hypothetical protein RDV41_01805 [Planctomycetota bacterium]|nr:hypothetical protein [Planctomycetota bacterium]